MLNAVLKRRKKNPDQYNPKFVSNFLRNFLLAVLSRAINCEFSIAFEFLRPD